MRSKTSLSIVMIGLAAYLLSPVAVWFGLEYELASGTFPVDADSIGLPMFGFLILWLGGLLAGGIIAVSATISGGK